MGFILLTRGHTSIPGVAAPDVQFVGNASCPTDGNSAYGAAAPSTNASPAVGQTVAEMPHNHVDPPTKITYLHDPPTSGCHYNLGAGKAPLSPGLYDTPVSPEYWVHNLEHGYVVVLYNCPAGCAGDVATLRAWYGGLANDPLLSTEKKVLVLPETTMATRFAVVSWDWYLALDRLDLSRVQAFYLNHRDQSPESNQAP
ncbi:MAG: DUF3105 domain-containing protein [Candidatus Dormibacter sp.]